MNKNKYYKVTETRDHAGNTVFTIYGCENWFSKIAGFWNEYTLTSRTLADAIKHIESLVSWKIVKETVVYRKRVK